jgi:cobalt-zinc-cadmium efflux system membrane fusion protein
MKMRISICLAAIVMLSGCGKSSGETAKSNAAEQPVPASTAESTPENVLRIKPEMLRDVRVTTAEVEERPGGDGVHLLGELRVNENAYAEVGTPITARVVTVMAAPAQPVAKGQDMALLQSPELGKARAELITAQARLDLAKKTLERKRTLSVEKIVPERDVQEAEANVATSDAEVRAARATLRALGAGDESSDSSQFVLRSPISGTVIERSAWQGQMADPARPLFRVAGMSHLWLTLHAFERDAVRIRMGGTARITFAALPGRSFKGKVTLVGKQVDVDSRTVAVRIEVENAQLALRPGMSATAFVALGKGTERIIAVPTVSLQRLDEDWIVFIPAGSGSYEIRVVGRGRDLGGEVEIVSGLKPGEKVVVEGAFLLKVEAEKLKSEGKEHAH